MAGEVAGAEGEGARAQEDQEAHPCSFTRLRLPSWAQTPALTQANGHGGRLCPRRGLRRALRASEPLLRVPEASQGATGQLAPDLCSRPQGSRVLGEAPVVPKMPTRSLLGRSSGKAPPCTEPWGRAVLWPYGGTESNRTWFWSQSHLSWNLSAANSLPGTSGQVTICSAPGVPLVL